MSFHLKAAVLRQFVPILYNDGPKAFLRKHMSTLFFFQNRSPLLSSKAKHLRMLIDFLRALV